MKMVKVVEDDQTGLKNPDTPRLGLFNAQCPCAQRANLGRAFYLQVDISMNELSRRGITL
jgi:hypothetical protein